MWVEGTRHDTVKDFEGMALSPAESQGTSFEETRGPFVSKKGDVSQEAINAVSLGRDF